jgi:hypothetical protein
MANPAGPDAKKEFPTSRFRGVYLAKLKRI